MRTSFSSAANFSIWRAGETKNWLRVLVMGRACTGNRKKKSVIVGCHAQWQHPLSKLQVVPKLGTVHGQTGPLLQETQKDFVWQQMCKTLCDTLSCPTALPPSLPATPGWSGRLWQCTLHSSARGLGACGTGSAVPMCIAMATGMLSEMPCHQVLRILPAM